MHGPRADSAAIHGVRDELSASRVELAVPSKGGDRHPRVEPASRKLALSRGEHALAHDRARIASRCPQHLLGCKRRHFHMNINTI